MAGFLDSLLSISLGIQNQAKIYPLSVRSVFRYWDPTLGSMDRRKFA